jgi:hypothetical protein
MTTLTIELPEERMRELVERAAQLRVSPESLVVASIEQLLRATPSEDLKQAVDHVLRKNAELYRRLA